MLLLSDKSPAGVKRRTGPAKMPQPTLVGVVSVRIDDSKLGDYLMADSGGKLHSMRRLFALTVFAGAALLFTVEPLVGRLLLPLAGGTPSVWTTCLLFFQAALLAGYAYAHGVGDRLPIRAQVPIHLAVIGVAACFLPIGLSSHQAIDSARPVLALLPMLARLVGLPFFAVSTTAPLMQRWFSAVDAKRDPYPLYAASNTGSLLALMAYPFLIEPALGLDVQGNGWAWAYGLFALLIVACAVAAWFAPAGRAPMIVQADRQPHPWMRWLLLSFAPSSLLLGVTTTITTDLTPVPLLWVVPLALYLLTFILAFAGRSIVPHRLVLRLAPIGALMVFFVLLTNVTQPWWAVLSIHLLGVFFISLACHGELARLKPPAAGLTRFYLIMSVGGALGGLLNAVIAPIVFRKIGLAEFPVALAIAIALMPRRSRAAAVPNAGVSRDLGRVVYPILVTIVTVTTLLIAGDNGKPGGLVFGLCLVFVYLLVDRPMQYSAGLLAMWIASLLFAGQAGRPLLLERNFFGINKVTLWTNPADKQQSHLLLHGSTIHGRQFWNGDRAVNEPLAYYGRTSPVGDAFKWIESRGNPPVAAIGMGAGSIAAYAKPGQAFTFYEIDPAVVRIAQDAKLFRFLTDNFPNGDGMKIVLGDGRLEIASAADGSYGLIVLDAFSSDSIPVHLLTREAVELYRRKLSPGGVIVFHISNRYLNLKPVLASAARDLGLVARYRYQNLDTEVSERKGTTSSTWVALANSESDLGPRAERPWKPMPSLPKGFRTWTDDYSNLLSVFMLSGN